VSTLDAKKIKEKVSQGEAVKAEQVAAAIQGELQNESVQEEATFEISLLREHCKELFGVQPEVFDGAFYNASGKFSKEEARKHIDAFLNKKVNTKVSE
jgi:hypothetical protein